MWVERRARRGKVIPGPTVLVGGAATEELPSPRDLPRCASEAPADHAPRTPLQEGQSEPAVGTHDKQPCYKKTRGTPVQDLLLEVRGQVSHGPKAGGALS